MRPSDRHADHPAQFGVAWDSPRRRQSRCLDREPPSGVSVLLAGRLQPAAALGRQDHQVDQVVGMDDGEAVRGQAGGKVKAEAGDHAEDGQHGRVRLAEDDRRPHDGDGDLPGHLPRRPAPRRACSVHSATPAPADRLRGGAARRRRGRRPPARRRSPAPAGSGCSAKACGQVAHPLLVDAEELFGCRVRRQPAR